MQYPPFREFRSKIYNKINKDERNSLFFYSLFDPSTWEESETTAGSLPAYLPKIKNRQGSVLGILKRSKSIRKKYITPDPDAFFRHFVDGETLTNYILTAALLDYLREQKIKGYLPADISKRIFPDIYLKKKKNPKSNVYLEIKGIVGTTNLYNRIEDEVLKELKKGRRKYKDFALILIFPCVNQEADRINHIIKGYYYYERLLGRSSKNNRRVLCCCMTRQNHNDPFCLNNLVQRIFNLNYFTKL